MKLIFSAKGRSIVLYQGCSNLNTIKAFNLTKFNRKKSFVGNYKYSKFLILNFTVKKINFVKNTLLFKIQILFQYIKLALYEIPETLFKFSYIKIIRAYI